MTTITFKPDSAHQFVNWNDPARWSGGVVPNDPAVDVIIPTTTVVATGDIYDSFITESGAFAVGSLAISNNFLLLNGALTITHDLNISAGGEIDMRAGSSLSAASIDNNGIDIQGNGSINVTGLFRNESEVVGNGLSLTAGSLINPGSLIAASGNLTVTVSHGGFSNLSGSTLTGGTYQAGFSANTTANSNILYLDVGSVIGTDAANISLDGGGAIYSFDDASHTWVSITSSMHSIAASGTLSLEHQTFTWSDLTVDGSVTLAKATLNATHLTIDSGGKIAGTGAIGGPIVDSGTIVARVVDSFQAAASDGLALTGPVSGSGTIEIAEAIVTRHTGITFYDSVPVELAAATSANVFFDDGHGTLTLDDPSEFSGKIRPAAAGDQIVLRGISISSVTSYSYSGNASGGTLAIHTTGGETDLHFLGNFTTSNFTLAAGPQHLSSDPQSLLITNTGSAPTVLAPIAEDSGIRLITQAELVAGFVGTSPVANGLAIASGNGTLVDNHNGTWSYTPAHNDDSGVSFAYSVTYSGGTVAESATLDITPVNDAPVATNSSASGAEDATISGAVSASDVDNSSSQLSYALVGANGGASHGTVVLHPDGSFSYTPVHDFNGNDSFSFKASDGSLDSNVATESLTIGAVNDAPFATNSSASGAEDTTISGAVSASDVDNSSSQLSYALVGANGGASHGTVVLHPDGSFSYTPVHDFNGNDSFSFKASDGSLDSNVATESLTIGAVNDAPFATNSSASGAEDTTISGAVSASDVDNSSSQLSYALVGANGGASHGTVVLHADGSFSYTPVHDFNGNDSFSFKASDGSLDSNVATESLTIGAVNDAPVNTVPGPLSVQGGIDTSIAGLAVSDVDATSLTTTLHVDHGALAVGALGGATVAGSGTATVTLTGSVAQIDAALAATNNVLYRSAFDFSGIDHLTITSNDGGSSGAGGALTDTDIVNLQVAAASIQVIETPPHLAFSGIGTTSATGPAAELGQTLDADSPGLLSLSDFHLI